ncbi:MAG: hypothetical protein WC784_02910 [Candidatus Shapirobacteria bacterium]|jgi:hypothetical protein
MNSYEKLLATTEPSFIGELQAGAEANSHLLQSITFGRVLLEAGQPLPGALAIILGIGEAMCHCQTVSSQIPQLRTTAK